MNNKALHTAAFILLIIGGLNWLLIGLGINWELASLTNAISPLLTQVIYILIGLAAIYEVIKHKSTCKSCEVSASSAPSGMGGGSTM